MSVRLICIHVYRMAVDHKVDIITSVEEVDVEANVYEFCESRGADCAAVIRGVAERCLTDALDSADSWLFPTDEEQSLWVNVCAPIHMDKAHRSFHITGSPERLLQLIQRELGDWARMVQRERVIGRGERVLA